MLYFIIYTSLLTKLDVTSDSIENQVSLLNLQTNHRFLKRPLTPKIHYTRFPVTSL